MGRHLVLVLLLGGLVEQVQQQLEQTAVGCGKDQKQQLQGFNLALFVWSAGLIPLLIKQSQVCQGTRRRTYIATQNSRPVAISYLSCFACRSLPNTALGPLSASPKLPN